MLLPAILSIGSALRAAYLPSNALPTTGVLFMAGVPFSIQHRPPSRYGLSLKHGNKLLPESTSQCCHLPTNYVLNNYCYCCFAALVQTRHNWAKTELFFVRLQTKKEKLYSHVTICRSSRWSLRDSAASQLAS